MESVERRKRVIEILSTSKEPVTGSDLAGKLGVSRQVIVQDVALLRAKGKEIIATPQGYMFFYPKGSRTMRRTFACKHYLDNTRKELNIFVDCGGIVEDVIVEHPIYGQISGSLMLKSRTDVDKFCSMAAGGGAALLSSLTEGVHLHTISSEDAGVFAQIEIKLREAGLLLA